MKTYIKDPKSKEKFLNLKRNKVFLKSELDANKKLNSQELNFNKPIKKLSDFKNFEAILNSKNNEEKVKKLVELKIEKYLNLKLSKNLNLVKPQNMKKKVESLVKLLNDFPIKLKEMIEEKLQDSLSFILLRKFSTVYFGKTFKIFTEIPENHLKQTFKNQVNSYNSTMKFLSLLKQQQQEKKIIVDVKKIELIHLRFKFLIDLLTKSGLILDTEGLPNCLNRHEIEETEKENSKFILDQGFKILICLLSKLLILNYSYWILKFNSWLKGEIIGDEENEKEAFALENCIEYVNDIIANIEDPGISQSSLNTFFEILDSIIAYNKLLDEGENRKLFKEKFKLI